MDAKGKKQADLVRETGLDRGSISSYLSGKYEPKQKAIFKLSKALGVSEAWLLGYEVPMDRTEDQKKNDQLVKLVARLRTDEGFFSTVSTLAELTAEQYQSIELLVSTLKK
jgi:transcriptional regulator with XRE-family HTH domain